MTIVQSAIRIADKVWTGHRHHNIFRIIWEETGRVAHEIAEEQEAVVEQGFVTDTGEFVDRILAAQIAIENGQIQELAHPPNLYSEDLY